MIDILLFSHHVNISDQVHLLETISDLDEDELVFMVSQMRDVIGQNQWNIEIVNMQETLDEIKKLMAGIQKPLMPWPWLTLMA